MFFLLSVHVVIATEHSDFHSVLFLIVTWTTTDTSAARDVTFLDIYYYLLLTRTGRSTVTVCCFPQWDTGVIPCVFTTVFALWVVTVIFLIVC